MDRLTEYHGEKAVIKDKVLLPQAMQKLAEYEELEEKDCVIRWHPADEPPSDDRYIYCRSKMRWRHPSGDTRGMKLVARITSTKAKNHVFSTEL